MRLSEFHREVWGLDRIVFRNQPLDRRDLPRVFAARDKELDRASVAVFDAPRNLLVNGLFGIGKTVFIEALLRDLHESHPNEVLCVSERLDGVDSDLKTTILRGLAKALRHEDEEAGNIHQLLTGVELTTQQTDKASDSGEVGVSGLFKIGGGGESSVTESWARKLVPNAAYQVRELIERAMERCPDRRLIVAVDDLDKRDPETVRANLADARSTLHNDCSFILTGHPLGILREAYSSVGGIFDSPLELKVLASDSMRQLIVNYLEAGRRADAPERGLFPFTEESAQAIIRRAFGIPRVLNMICLNILQEAGELQRRLVDMETLRECWQRASDRLKQAIHADVRNMIEVLRQQAEGLDPLQASDEVLESFGVDSYGDLIARINAVLREDLIVGIEIAGRSRFLPQPLLQPLPEPEAETDTEKPDTTE